MADRAYGFRIVWSDEDGAYVASCPEFPGVVAHGDTPEEAVTEARVALEAAIEMYEEEGRELPAARGLLEHSGQFRLRVPKTLHAQLVQRADEEDISLNSYITTVIAAAVGQAHAETRTATELRATLNEVRSQLANELVVSGAQPTTLNESQSAAETPATIFFGLVSIPVNVHSSLRVEDERPLLRVPYDGVIDIVEFVPLKAIDREYIEKVYYLGPDKGGDRAYRLLAAALKESGRAAVGQYAGRGQQHLVLLRPLNGLLVMEQLHYADELRPTTEVTIPAGEVKEAELKLAMQLIDQTSNEELELGKYKHTAHEHVIGPPPDTDDKVIDIMDAIKKSLAKPKNQKTRKKVS
jgi:predicted RNase H-like HicB family nuclease